jgi:hypothetical protein
MWKEAVIDICLEGLRKTTINLRIVDVSAEIRTRYVLNRCQQRYCSADVIRKEAHTEPLLDRNRV